ncbi:MAG: dual specificity protein phosphatase family protein [Nanoarchaeota archaeon]|nr:dual specificity protein phosphatase family protein [Nanoarchaeota archaeon]
MIQVCKNLSVGTTSDCFYDEKEDYAVVHACKTPCHQRKLHYNRNLPPTHPNYLIYEEENHLYLNIVDMDRILSKFADPIFLKAIEFIEKNISTKNILIHCNLGQSRSPAIALVYMAKNELITNSSYTDAISEFVKNGQGLLCGV